MEPTKRITLNLGVDQFSFDSDGEIYRNGYGRIPHTEFITYNNEDSSKGKLLRVELLTMLYGFGYEPWDAVRRTRMAQHLMFLSDRKKKARTLAGTEATRAPVYCKTTRKKYKSMSEAAEKLGFSVAALAQSIRENRAIKGLRFRKL